MNEYYLFVRFSKEKKDQSFNSFRVASTLESINGPLYYNEEDVDESNSSTNEFELTEIGQLCSKFIDRFEEELLKFHHLIAITTIVGGSLSSGALEGHVLPPTKKHGTLMEKDETSEIYGLTEDGAEIVFKHFEKMNEITAGLSALPSSLLLSLVASYDSLIGDFISELLKLKPERVQLSEKTITYREIFKIGNVSKLLDEAIENEVAQLLRTSHYDQIDYIEKLVETKILGSYERLPNYLEIFERRNQIAHASGNVTQRYLDKCRQYKYPTDGIEIGSKFKLDPKYLHKAVDHLAEFGVTLAFMAWQKLGVKDPKAFTKMNRACYELIVKRRYKLAGNLLDFCLRKQNCDADEVTRRMMYINLANSHARAGKRELAEEILAELDWTASSDQFRICVAAVQGNVEEVCKLMPQAVASESISKSALRTWPVFDNVKDAKDFALSFPFIPLTHVEHDANKWAWKRNRPLHRLNFRSANFSPASRLMMPVSITSWPFALVERALSARHAARKAATIN